ncbi:MAG: flagellar motor switch protein FliN [Planctomycetota bacterium]
MADEQHAHDQAQPDANPQAAAETPAESETDTAGSPLGHEGVDDASLDALRAAQEAVGAISQEAGAEAGQPDVVGAAAAFVPPSFDAALADGAPKGLDMLSDVDVQVTIELGRTKMLIEDVLRLSQGAVVELDKLAGDPVDVYVNERLVARGEVLVLNDNFCVRVNEILDADIVEPS